MGVGHQVRESQHVEPLGVGDWWFGGLVGWVVGDLLVDGWVDKWVWGCGGSVRAGHHQAAGGPGRFRPLVKERRPAGWDEGVTTSQRLIGAEHWLKC